MKPYALGLDFGTLSVRALLLDCQTGEERAEAVCEYAHGVMDRALPTGEALPPLWALQHPADYEESLEQAVKELLAKTGIDPCEIGGIGVDFTSSTVIPVKADSTPLCLLPAWEREPHAYVKLWKHHGAEEEAAAIEELARKVGAPWLSSYGGKVSCEWMLPKIWETLRAAPCVYEDADFFMEAGDWIVWRLTGEHRRNSGVAAFKMFYQEEGYPSDDFLALLDPRLAGLSQTKLKAPMDAVGDVAGRLTESAARRLGLAAGTPVGSAIIDAHAAVLGSGVCRPGPCVVVMGTSGCHLLLSEKKEGFPGIPCVAKDAFLPGYYGVEGGQGCVGDLFGHYAKTEIPASYEKEAEERGISPLALMEEKLKGVGAGESGLLALDWHGGVRSPLMDYRLSGLILGITLQTRPEEMFLAWMESVAFGTRSILECFAASGREVTELILGGGIPYKNRRLVQILADVCAIPVHLCASRQASARGAAILGALAAEEEGESVEGLVSRLGAGAEETVLPQEKERAVYETLYQEYCRLGAYFAKGENDVMKRLMAMRQGLLQEKREEK